MGRGGAWGAGAAGSPETVSGGNATTPPLRSRLAARVRPARVGFRVRGPRELTPKALSSWGWRTTLRSPYLGHRDRGARCGLKRRGSPRGGDPRGRLGGPRPEA